MASSSTWSALSSVLFHQAEAEQEQHQFLMTAALGSFLVLVCLFMLAASFWTATSSAEALLPPLSWVPQKAPPQLQPPPSPRTSPRRGVRESFSFQWWDELAPPFADTSSHHGSDNENNSNEGGDDLRSSDESTREQPPSISTRHSHEEPPRNDDDFCNPVPDVLHFCFLIHGYRGYARDLSYLQTVMERAVTTELQRQRQQQQQQQRRRNSSRSRNGNRSPIHNDESDTDSHTAPCETETAAATLRHDVILHTPVCNERKTDDGVVSGGERLVAEIREFIEKELAERRRSASSTHGHNGHTHPLPRITISLLGNSLGGLYARYALAKLSEGCSRTTDDATGQVRLTLNGQHRVDFNVFCTTATPHLGVASHTFLPIPRTAEISLAQAMRSTGKDLFRCNDLLRRMATTTEFLRPLGSFRRRIAYANAYGTDFPVPVHTAAFLNEASASPHYFDDDEHDDTNVPRPHENSATVEADADGLIIAKVYTPRRETDWGTSSIPSSGTVAAGASRVDKVSTRSSSGMSTDSSNNETECSRNDNDDDDDAVVWAHDMDETDELELMSQTLDTLGWRKVFVDARKNMPKIPLFGLSIRSSSSSNLEDGSNSGSEGDDSVADDRQARSESIARLKSTKGLLIESKELALAVTAPLFDDNFHWPVGHNMIVAFSRSRLSSYLNKAGRPVVDSIARTLVQDILEWSPEESPLAKP